MNSNGDGGDEGKEKVRGLFDKCWWREGWLPLVDDGRDFAVFVVVQGAIWTCDGVDGYFFRFASKLSSPSNDVLLVLQVLLSVEVTL